MRVRVTPGFLFLFLLRPDITGKTQDEPQDCLHLFLVFYIFICHAVGRKMDFVSPRTLTRTAEQASLLKQPSIELTCVGLVCIFILACDLCFSLFSK